MEFKDYYKIMGLTPDAKPEDVKRAYRKLARKYHPDVSKEAKAEERFKELGEAYEVLKDPAKRSAYDQAAQRWRQGEPFTPPPGWQTHYETHSGDFGGADFGGFSDFFEALFGQPGMRRSRRGPAEGFGGFSMPGTDIHARIHITLEQAYQGGSQTLTLTGGAELNASGKPVDKTRTLHVKIPKGVKEGQRIRLPGQGNPGYGDAPKGDLYLEIRFHPHRLFHAEERTIFLDLPITPWEAALGATVPVPTLGGPVELKIPPGSQTGNKLRLRERGLPGTPPGDQYVTLKIFTPPAGSDAARAAYQELARLMPFNPRAHFGG